jgi:enterochelin esterase family protein
LFRSWTGNYRTIPDRDHRGIMGRSSGGFGAITQAMQHPEIFGALACQSGDLYWEYTCLPNLSKMHQQLEKYGGLAAFIRDIPEIRPKSGAFWDLIMTVCWAAAFGGNPDSPHGFDLPIDPETGALDEAVWARWLEHDPIRKLDNSIYARALRTMKTILSMSGYTTNTKPGARVLHRKLERLGIPHVYEEYPDGHRGTHYRYEHALARLYAALRPE